MKPRQSAAGQTRLGQIGEDVLLQKLSGLLPIDHRVIAGSGGDAAIVASPNRGDLLVLKTDCVVEGIHFDRSSPAEAVGWKAMMRSLSDFAAVSGLPDFGLITLIVQRETELGWVTGVYRGLGRAARRFKVSIVGGETSSTPGPAAIAVSVVGHVERRRWVSRSGGKPGDDLFVTGRLGGSIRGKHLQFVPRIEESRWLTSRFRIAAMMDLSDGLGTDLPRLAQASEVGFTIDKAKIPLSRGVNATNAVSDGEDYELLFAISPQQSEHLTKCWFKKFPRVPLTKIGSLIRKSSRRKPQLHRGYDHFQ